MSSWPQYLQLPGPRAQAQDLWCPALVALRQVGSSQTRGRTHVTCFGRWVHNHPASPGSPGLNCFLIHSRFQIEQRTQYRVDFFFLSPNFCMRLNSIQAGLFWLPPWKWKSLSRVWLFPTPWTIQSMEFSRPEYWSGEPFPSPGDLPNTGSEPRSPSLQVDSLSAEPQEYWSG